jgi:hypothetical protein
VTRPAKKRTKGPRIVPKPALGVRIDTRELERQAKAFGDLAARQAPFAIARGLSELAKGGSVHVQRQLRRSFKVRNRGLTKAIAWNGARKNDAPPTAHVGVRPWAAFLRLQSEGGTKRGKHGHRIAIPTSLVKRGRGGRVKKPDKPRTLRAHKGLKKGELDEGRIAVKKRGKKRSIYFVLRASVKIKARWPFREQVFDHVRRNYGHTMTRSLRDALRTARRR